MHGLLSEISTVEKTKKKKNPPSSDVFRHETVRGTIDNSKSIDDKASGWGDISIVSCNSMAESNNAKFENHPLDGSEDAAGKCLKTSEKGEFFFPPTPNCEFRCPKTPKSGLVESWTRC